MNFEYANPFDAFSVQYDVWETLIRNDFEGFLKSDWSIVSEDFLSKGFFGVDMVKSQNPSDWKLTFPTLNAYKRQWLVDSLSFNKKNFELTQEKFCTPQLNWKISILRKINY